MAKVSFPSSARLPKNWPSQVKAAVLQVISLV